MLLALTGSAAKRFDLVYRALELQDAGNRSTSCPRTIHLDAVEGEKVSTSHSEIEYQ